MPEYFDPDFSFPLQDANPETCYGLCSRGICPINLDSFSSCPVMEYANKSCSEIRLEDWIGLSRRQSKASGINNE